MGRKAKYSKELRLEIIKRYINGESAISLANEYGMPKNGRNQIHRWANRFKMLGESVFEETTKNKKYSKEFKLKVIKAYLNGEGSFDDLANLYNVSKDVIVRQWVLKYNEGIEIKDYDPKSEVYTMKTRKTTVEERLDIVKYALDNDYDYKGAADKFSVPYASVYQWVKKYKDHGENGLIDNRGRKSSSTPKQQLTTEEKQAIEIEKLKHELEREKMINEVLKKNIEIRERMEIDSRLLGKKTSTKL